MVYGIVYSADASSDLYLPRNQTTALPSDGVIFSDDGTGNVFYFPVVDGVAEDTVLMYDHETQ